MSNDYMGNEVFRGLQRLGSPDYLEPEPEPIEPEPIERGSGITDRSPSAIEAESAHLRERAKEKLKHSDWMFDRVLKGY